MPDYGTHSFSEVSKRRVDAILEELLAHGCDITGNNPWIIETREHGVRLKGEWSEESLTLKVTVTDANWYVTKKAVWDNIDSLLSRIRDTG